MTRPSYLVLNKTEWDRLKRRPSPKSLKSDKNDYINSLIEQSQNWIKTWPDTVQVNEKGQISILLYICNLSINLK